MEINLKSAFFGTQIAAGHLALSTNGQDLESACITFGVTSGLRVSFMLGCSFPCARRSFYSEGCWRDSLREGLHASTDRRIPDRESERG
jgi:hypothetical protein